MACFSVWDIQGCGCGGIACACSPCNLPAKDLILSWTGTNITATYGTSPRTLPQGVCNWGSSWSHGSTISNTAQVTCVALGGGVNATKIIMTWNDSGTATNDSETGQSNLNLALRLIAYTCSPFHMQWQVYGEDSTCPGSCIPTSQYFFLDEAP